MHMLQSALVPAMLAAVGCGTYHSVEEVADAVVQVTETTEPDGCTHSRYNEKYAEFQEIYPALKAIHKGL